MIDLGLNQYKIKEIKYEVKEGKTVIFKLNNFNLEDVEIVETTIDKKDAYPPKECKCEKKCSCADKTYELDRQIINEHIEEEENKKAKNIERLCNVDKEKCKELMKALDSIPYKIFGKIGEIRTDSNGKGMFLTESDPYVVNDERELPKQSHKQLLEEEMATLKASYNKDWIESIKDKKILPGHYAYINLDKKYEGMPTNEKREISKKIIDEDAKKDTKIIKERVDNAIGTNSPLSEELINASG